MPLFSAISKRRLFIMREYRLCYLKQKEITTIMHAEIRMIGDNEFFCACKKRKKRASLDKSWIFATYLKSNLDIIWEQMIQSTMFNFITLIR